MNDVEILSADLTTNGHNLQLVDGRWVVNAMAVVDSFLSAAELTN